MAKKTNEGYMCTSCEKIYPTPAKADACRDSHDIIYVPMNRTEINRLITGIFLNDVSIIPESLLVTLRKLQRISVRDGVQKEV